jgi:plasmid replication initiation protein
MKIQAPKKKLKPIRLIKKSNDLIEARHSLTTWEMRIFLKIIFLVNEEKYKGSTNFVIPIRELIKDFKLENSKNSYKLFREAREALATRTIQIYQNNKETGSWERVNKSLFMETAHSVKMQSDGTISEDEDGYIRLQLHEQIKPFLLNINGSLDGNYTLFDKNYALELPLKMLRFYLLLKRFADTGYREMTVDELRDIFDLEDKYKSYGNIKQRIIDKAQKDLAEKTDIRFEYEEVKQVGSKTVAKIKFRIFPNTPQSERAQKLLPTPPSPPVEKNRVISPPSGVHKDFDALFDRYFTVVRPFGISATTLSQWIQQHSAKHIESCITDFLARVQSGKLRETEKEKQGGYLRRLIEQADFSERDRVEVAKIEKQERQRTQEQIAAEQAQIKKQMERERAERDRQTVFQIIAENPRLEQEILDDINRRDGTAYAHADVLTYPFLASKIWLRIRQIYPERFEENRDKKH